MGRWSLASRLCERAASSPKIYSALQNAGLERQIKCRHLMQSAARMATKSGDGDGKGSAKWRDWVEEKIAKTPPSPPSPKATPTSNAVDDFERYVLGKTGDDEEEDYHEIRESVDPVLQRAAAADQQQQAKSGDDDDFLEELTNIERSGASFPSDFGKKDSNDLMMKRGYDDDTVPFDDEIDPENDESLLSEDAVFWNEELQKFVTPKGLLDLPGVGGKEDLNRPHQLRPDRTYFPGQVIEPEDFDVTRIPSNDVLDTSFKSKKAYRKREVLAAADFRNVKFLSQFLTETSRILPRRTTSVTWKCQRKLSREIRTARWLGLIPFTSMGDPPFRYLKNKPAKDVDPEDEYEEIEEDDSRFRRRLY